MDREQVTQMLIVLEQQIHLLNDLGDVAEKKAHVLVRQQLPELDALLRAEQALHFRLGRLEDRRLHLQGLLARAAGIPIEAMRLDEVCRRVPSDLVGRCVELAGQFSGAVENLQFRNQVNMELTEQAMAFADFSLRLLGARDMGPRRAAYSPDRHSRAERKPATVRRLDDRA